MVHEKSGTKSCHQAVASKPEKVPEEFLGPGSGESAPGFAKQAGAKHMPYLCVQDTMYDVMMYICIYIYIYVYTYIIDSYLWVLFLLLFLLLKLLNDGDRAG